MDINGILHAAADFFATDFGRIVYQALNAIYTFLFPANAPGAQDVPLPTPKPPAA
ncbi:hypothetical protein [Corynebacterium heidelbergense]|uniref:hypothetical protein n=1 Tax=Corynebacterium heidelbergense TaxID=2055947 RepID=UPI001401E521|nr:hypothetical protein [Corynebacterium heidelbergense]